MLYTQLFYDSQDYDFNNVQNPYVLSATHVGQVVDQQYQ